MPGHEVELWVPQFHLGTPAAHASNAVPPFQVVTPAPFLPHLSLIIKACCLHGILIPAEKFVDKPWTSGESSTLDGPIEILGHISRGGQGTVYQARDTILGHIVAVKVINQPVVDDPQYLETLKREGQLAAHLDHTNVKGVHDFLMEDGIPYIVME